MADNPNVFGDIQKQQADNQKQLDLLAAMLKKLEELEEEDRKKGSPVTSSPSYQKALKNLQGVLPSVPSVVGASTVAPAANTTVQPANPIVSPKPIPVYLASKQGVALPISKGAIPVAAPATLPIPKSGTSTIPVPVVGPPPLPRVGPPPLPRVGPPPLPVPTAVPSTAPVGPIRAKTQRTRLGRLAKRARILTKSLARRFNRNKPAMGLMASHIGATAQSQTLQGIGGGVSGATGAFGSMMPGRIGQTLQVIGTFGESLFKVIGTLRNWGDSLHSANMHFAEFSGAMSVVQAKQEVRDIELSRQRGDRRAKGADELAEARHSFNATVAPIEDAAAGLFNKIGSWLYKIGDTVAKPYAKGLGEAKDNKGDGYMGEWLWDIANDDKWVEKFERPDRF